MSNSLRPCGLFQARILVWVAFSFSRESPQPRDQTQVSCFAIRFFTSWATKEAQEYWLKRVIHTNGLKKIQQYKIYAVKISPNQPSFLPEAATDNFFVFPFRIVLYVNIQLSISFLFNRWHMIHTVQDFVLSIKWRILELLLISTYYSLLSFFKKVASFAIAWVHFHVINQIPTKWTLRLFLVFYLKKYYSGHDFTWIFEFISEIIC